MNLPIFNELQNSESTYITFSHSYVDMDSAIANGTEFYYSKVVALKLPDWQVGAFYTDDLKTIGTDSALLSTSPNMILPKVLQYYTENIIRQDIDAPHITELAFWKTLKFLGIENPTETVCFVNDVINSNFVKTESNNGWNEVICQIPNLCRKLKTVATKEVEINSIIQTNDKDSALYDNGNKQFLFDTATKKVLDFPNFVFDSKEKSSFEFNTLLLFYRDKDGIDKLHGINFIYPFENKVTFWRQNNLIQKTNVTNSIGYQFIFNMKTCNNEASLEKINILNENLMWWNGFEKTMTSLNSFLEDKIREKNNIEPIPNIYTD